MRPGAFGPKAAAIAPGGLPGWTTCLAGGLPGWGPAWLGAWLAGWGPGWLDRWLRSGARSGICVRDRAAFGKKRVGGAARVRPHVYARSGRVPIARSAIARSLYGTEGRGGGTTKVLK